jgi:hypothetical protein
MLARRQGGNLNKDWKPTPPRSPADWKALLPLAILLTACAVVLIVFDRRAFGIITTCLALPTSFVAGYLFRADFQRRGATPPVPFLRVKGDEE